MESSDEFKELIITGLKKLPDSYEPQVTDALCETLHRSFDDLVQQCINVVNTKGLDNDIVPIEYREEYLEGDNHVMLQMIKQRIEGDEFIVLHKNVEIAIKCVESLFRRRKPDPIDFDGVVLFSYGRDVLHLKNGSKKRRGHSIFIGLEDLRNSIMKFARTNVGFEKDLVKEQITERLETPWTNYRLIAAFAVFSFFVVSAAVSGYS